jgi:dCMP deaminase
MLLINTGVKRVVAANKYHAGQESEEMFKKAKIKLEFMSNEVLTYQAAKTVISTEVVKYKK